MSLMAFGCLQIQKISFPLDKRAQRKCLGLDQHYGLQSQIRWLNQKKKFKFLNIWGKVISVWIFLEPAILGPQNSSKRPKMAYFSSFCPFDTLQRCSLIVNRLLDSLIGTSVATNNSLFEYSNNRRPNNDIRIRSFLK